MNLSSPFSSLSWTRLSIQLFLLGSASLLLCLAGEFRFCYKGPHRILYKDCPGGFVSKTAFKPTCMYYRPTGEASLSTTWSPNICDVEKSTEMNEETETGKFPQDDFQSIEFYEVANGTVEGVDPRPEACNDTCLTEWLEAKYWNPAQVFVDKDTLNDSASTAYQLEYVELTKVILIKIINEDEFDEDLELNLNSSTPTNLTFNSPTANFLANATAATGGESKTDFLVGNGTLLTKPLTSLMKLLAKSMRITYMKCAPFIEQSFYTLVFRTMIAFRRMNDNFPDMNVMPLKRIMNILDRCEAEQPSHFALNGTQCDDKYAVQTITNLIKNVSTPHRLEPTSFRWGRYDPIIEAAWSAVTFVHAYCFDLFVEDMLHYSLYVKGMHEIFAQPRVEKHWMYPFPVGKGMTLWEMAYDTPDIQNQMDNLDACVQGGYLGSVFEGRLDRTFNRQEFLENPTYEEDPKIPAPGWKKSIDEYWRMYERNGFAEMVDILGFCANSTQEVADKTDEYAEQSCFTT